MKYLLIALRILANIFIFIVYSLVFINFVNFVYGLFVKFVMDSAVPGSSDPIHLQMAIFSLILVIILTIVFRKKFYLSVCEKNKDELEIFIDKEIK